MDPHGKLPLKGSRLVRVYKDAKRPILGGSGRLDRGQVCSRHKGDHLKPTTAAATGDHLEESFLWRGRSVHIEICDGTPTPVNMKRGRDQTAFDEAECWSQSEESEDEDELEVAWTNLTPKMNQQFEITQIDPHPQAPDSKMQALSNAERIWLNEYFNFHLINTSISRSNNTNVHIFDDILLEGDSEDDFDEMPPLTG